jgi:hypothetical protein
MHRVSDAPHTEQRSFAFPILANGNSPRPLYTLPDGAMLTSQRNPVPVLAINAITVSFEMPVRLPAATRSVDDKPIVRKL